MQNNMADQAYKLERAAILNRAVKRFVESKQEALGKMIPRGLLASDGEVE